MPIIGSMFVLNEVLSLNAQESVRRPHATAKLIFLNEVLSLNAQEFVSSPLRAFASMLTNEVLSLNAQEFVLPSADSWTRRASMKS